MHDSCKIPCSHLTCSISVHDSCTIACSHLTCFNSMSSSSTKTWIYLHNFSQWQHNSKFWVKISLGRFCRTLCVQRFRLRIYPCRGRFGFENRQSAWPFRAHLGFRLNFPDNTLCSALLPSVYLSIDLSESVSSSLLAEGTSTTEWERSSPKRLWGRGGLNYVWVR